jgi:hypothetical protein
MPRFDDSFDEDDVRRIQGYILHRAWELVGGYRTRLPRVMIQPTPLTEHRCQDHSR